MSAAMRKLIDAADELLAAIRPATHHGSLEDYLRNQLIDFRRAAVSATEPSDMQNAARALSRFCTEHMDWNTDLYRQCMALVQDVRGD